MNISMDNLFGNTSMNQGNILNFDNSFNLDTVTKEGSESILGGNGAVDGFLDLGLKGDGGFNLDQTLVFEDNIVGKEGMKRREEAEEEPLEVFLAKEREKKEKEDVARFADLDIYIKKVLKEERTVIIPGDKDEDRDMITDAYMWDELASTLALGLDDKEDQFEIETFGFKEFRQKCIEERDRVRLSFFNSCENDAKKIRNLIQKKKEKKSIFIESRDRKKVTRNTGKEILIANNEEEKEFVSKVKNEDFYGEIKWNGLLNPEFFQKKTKLINLSKVSLNIENFIISFKKKEYKIKSKRTKLEVVQDNGEMLEMLKVELWTENSSKIRNDFFLYKGKFHPLLDSILAYVTIQHLKPNQVMNYGIKKKEMGELNDLSLLIKIENFKEKEQKKPKRNPTKINSEVLISRIFTEKIEKLSREAKKPRSMLKDILNEKLNNSDIELCLKTISVEYFKEGFSIVEQAQNCYTCLWGTEMIMCYFNAKNRNKALRQFRDKFFEMISEAFERLFEDETNQILSSCGIVKQADESSSALASPFLKIGKQDGKKDRCVAQVGGSGDKFDRILELDQGDLEEKVSMFEIYGQLYYEKEETSVARAIHVLESIQEYFRANVGFFNTTLGEIHENLGNLNKKKSVVTAFLSIGRIFYLFRYPKLMSRVTQIEKYVMNGEFYFRIELIFKNKMNKIETEVISKNHEDHSVLEFYKTSFILNRLISPVLTFKDFLSVLIGYCRRAEIDKRVVWAKKYPRKVYNGNKVEFKKPKIRSSGQKNQFSRPKRVRRGASSSFRAKSKPKIENIIEKNRNFEVKDKSVKDIEDIQIQKKKQNVRKLRINLNYTINENSCEKPSKNFDKRDNLLDQLNAKNPKSNPKRKGNWDRNNGKRAKRKRSRPAKVKKRKETAEVQQNLRGIEKNSNGGQVKEKPEQVVVRRSKAKLRSVIKKKPKIVQNKKKKEPSPKKRVKKPTVKHNPKVIKAARVDKRKVRREKIKAQKSKIKNIEIQCPDLNTEKAPDIRITHVRADDGFQGKNNLEKKPLFLKNLELESEDESELSSLFSKSDEEEECNLEEISELANKNFLEMSSKKVEQQKQDILKELINPSNIARNLKKRKLEKKETLERPQTKSKRLKKASVYMHELQDLKKTQNSSTERKDCQEVFDLTGQSPPKQGTKKYSSLIKPLKVKRGSIISPFGRKPSSLAKPKFCQKNQISPKFLKKTPKIDILKEKSFQQKLDFIGLKDSLSLFSSDGSLKPEEIEENEIDLTRTESELTYFTRKSSYKRSEAQSPIKRSKMEQRKEILRKKKQIENCDFLGKFDLQKRGNTPIIDISEWEDGNSIIIG